MGVRHKLLIGLAVASMLVAACGDPETSPGTADSPTGSGQDTTPSATSVVVPVSESGNTAFAPVAPVDVREVDGPCPADVPVDMNSTESSATVEESSRLEPMMGVVLQYGTQHRDVFGGYGLHGVSAGDASVFASFTGDLAEHRAALAALVEYPDELIVCQAPVSEQERNAIQSTLIDELDGRFVEIDSGGRRGVVTIVLNATEDALASELVDRYGSAIEVSVGALTYPLEDATPVCAPRVEPSLLDGLEVEILDSTSPATMTRAGTVPLTVRLTNTSDQPMRFDSGQPATVITDALGAPLTSDTRAVAAVGIPVALDPAAHQDFDVDVTLASCDPSLGYVVPGGAHFVVISFYNAQLQGSMNSAPLPIEVVE